MTCNESSLIKSDQGTEKELSPGFSKLAYKKEPRLGSVPLRGAAQRRQVGGTQGMTRWHCSVGRRGRWCLVWPGWPPAPRSDLGWGGPAWHEGVQTRAVGRSWSSFWPAWIVIRRSACADRRWWHATARCRRGRGDRWRFRRCDTRCKPSRPPGSPGRSAPERSRHGGYHIRG
jgi:hypothetical protein